MPAVFEVPLFVSSPSDCEAERAEILAVVMELNGALGAALGLRVDAFDSRRLHPTVGAYPQAGINRQLEDHEIHVSVWRQRRGTPTPVAPSGTEEELWAALDRYERERRPAIMAYFWEHGEFDDVKALLKEHGRYFHLYADTAELGWLFRRHLADFLQVYRPLGHSSTDGPRRTEPNVHLTFDVHRPGEKTERLTFARWTVAVGRNPDVNQIVVTDRRIHREQGLFVWDDAGGLQYVDLARDAIVRAGGPPSGGLHPMTQEDQVSLPGGTTIVVRAIVS